MDTKKFIDLCKEIIKDYVNSHIEETGEKDLIKIDNEAIFVVWSCKTLQNNKALLSTTIPDLMYYECTYNGDKQEIYFDAYKKILNKAIKVE